MPQASINVPSNAPPDASASPALPILDYRGRLAPSPTGALHLGNARTFLVAWLRARQAGGRLVLRMEDIDSPRTKDGAVEEALVDLRWLGLDWDEGLGVGGPHAPYLQTDRRALYQGALEQLIRGGRVYPCTCTRKEIQEAASAPNAADGPVYPGTCRDRYLSGAAAEQATGRAPAWRFRVDASERVRIRDAYAGEHAFDGAQLGDFVVAKRQGSAAYQLAVVVDDAAMGVTEVVRADDLLPSAARQLMLYRALSLTAPRFVHVPLVVGACGRRLAKRHGDTRIRTIREAGVAPERLLAVMARWLGVEGGGGVEGGCGAGARGVDTEATITLAELVERFDLDAIPRGPWVFDVAQTATSLGAPGLFGR